MIRLSAAAPAGIFSGMFSPRDSHSVLAELGEPLPLALIAATRAARADLTALRIERPAFFMQMNERDLANRAHPQYWFALRQELEHLPEFSWRESGPYREMTFSTAGGRSYVSRVKRHSPSFRIRSATTKTDTVFWSGAQATFDGLETIPLALGYVWDRELREVREPVVSYHEGKNRVVWAYSIDEGAEAGTVTPAVYTNITPGLPTYDLRDATREAHEDGNELGRVDAG